MPDEGIAGKCPYCGGDVSDRYSDPINDMLECRDCGRDVYVGDVVREEPPEAAREAGEQEELL